MKFPQSVVQARAAAVIREKPAKTSLVIEVAVCCCLFKPAPLNASLGRSLPYAVLHVLCVAVLMFSMHSAWVMSLYIMAMKENNMCHCGEDFQSAKALRKHQQQQGHSSAGADFSDVVDVTSGQLLQCNWADCNKVYRSLQALCRHQKKQGHRDEAVGKLLCSVADCGVM